MASGEGSNTVDILHTVLAQIDKVLVEFLRLTKSPNAKKREVPLAQRRHLSAGTSSGGNKEEFSVALPALFRELKEGDTARMENMAEDLASSLLQEGSQWSVPLMSSRVDNHSLLMRLSRPETFKAVLGSVMASGDHFGRKDGVFNGRKVLVHDVSATAVECKGKETSLLQLRSVVLMQHVKHLLEAVGYSVNIVGRGKSQNDIIFTDKQVSIENTVTVGAHDFLPLKTENHDCRGGSDSLFKDNGDTGDTQLMKIKAIIDKIRECKYCREVEIPKREFQGDEIAGGEVKLKNDKEEQLCVDLKQYLRDSGFSQGKEGYDKSLDKLYIHTTNPYSPHLEQIVVLDEYVKLMMEKEPEVCIHVAPYTMSFMQQQVGLLWEMTSDAAKNISQVHLPFGPISARNTKGSVMLPTAEEFVSLRKRQTTEAFELKYGSGVGDPGWDLTIQSLTAAGIVFEFLTTVARNPLKLEFSQKSEVATKGGTFVMYNYARLATLMAHFDEAVVKGMFPPLPECSQLDFSALREEEEWLLLFNYILPFPSLVEDCVGPFHPGDPGAKIDTHKVCNFLLNLSRDLSSYYGRVHVLGEPFPHLLPTMYCRLHLLKGVQYVMSSAFRLLGIQPLTQM
ncbi:DALR anticodon-binding domain-containing protein 3 [Lingula anatina]|uniref:DALR anticodon-binding domain-containing protein 3 n=1 Tax=Lingula anatina TaxID=7574 RepID=A0A2R2MJB7_LINAN|nr:DALR anticodon-binding domain-containing protein 3 [Lingula anatina]|eukprot:XP_023930303.1 DALR anticodon-binding domain-containing protein 3 [Lingula anatina]